jgi:two-component system, LytTR family, sensor kinase
MTTRTDPTHFDDAEPEPVPEAIIGWHAVPLIIAFWTLYGIVTTAGLLFSPMADGPTAPVAVAAAIFLGAYTWAALTLPLFWLTRAMNLEGGHRPRRLAALFLLGLGIAALVSIGLAAISWAVLQRFTGLELDQQGLWLLARFRFLTDALACLLILAAGMARDYFLRYRERQQEASRLRAQLVESRLQFLRSQLNPHFLSNTMNAVSALVSKDPKGVRRMIARLSELLRYTLDAPSEPEVSLEQELRVLKQYLEILEIRFQGRLETSISADSDLLAARVPNMILQPLAENAMEHGVSHAGGFGKISISAHRDGDQLVLIVEDSGGQGGGLDDDDALSGDQPSRGFGLRHARDRLQQLYGANSSLELTPTAEGGMKAEIRIPLRLPVVTAAPAAEQPMVSASYA